MSENFVPSGESINPDLTPSPQPDITNEPATEREAEKERPSAIEKMQRRIDRLYAQKKSAEEAFEAERRRVAELEAKLQELQSHVYLNQAPLASALPSLSPISTPGSGVGVDEQKLAQVVRQAVEPLAQRIAAREAQERLLAAQEESWEAAELEFPEIAKPTSEVKRLAEQLLARDPELRNSPNGPYRAVVMAKGFLADRDVRTPEPVKAKASSVVGPAGSGEETRSRSQIRKEYEELLRRGINTPEEYVRAKRLRAQLKGE